jgi:uncharacterized Fe-S cluster protein YjdI
MSKEHTYSNGEVTIVWKSDLCIHSRKCWKGLGEVFKPGERPWINPSGASTDRIIEQVRQCPSGALTYRSETRSEEQRDVGAPVTEIEVTANGPLLVKGGAMVTHPDGRSDTHEKTTALCRCGASANKPYCDGSHRRAGFQG